MKNQESKTAGYLKIPLAISLIVLAYNLSFAGVSGTVHDMYSLGKGTDPNPCGYCHMPHKAAGEKIWSDWGNETQLTSGPSTAIGNMCYTCHDGTVTNVGLSTAFNASRQQHKIPAGQDCDMCHSVHDNTNGKFMNVVKKQQTYCAACHDAIVNAGGLGDMTSAGNHPSYWASTPAHNINGSPTGAFCTACHERVHYSQFDCRGCNFCHKAHDGTNYSTAQVPNPILKADNTDSQYCASCHPYKIQASSGGDKHPANLAAAGNWGKVICHDCHDPHQPGVTNHPFILTDTNVDSAMCINCHDNTAGPEIGVSHPHQIPFGSIVPTDGSAAAGTPAANAIDDDGEDGVDYPLNSANLICETCHGTHRRVDDAGTKLLRITNTNSALCLNCHTDK
ncbi:MAG: hypothetical protein COV72_02550 [Candidatus Omnitrophica bacterium CG11_big_fil_rev_8_21_14_0_20_42_13]|uniref:Doubled CXXCH motif domain-containing protein n=1 Tax=Candidatus Ghiorseimicrobium undicola TaxID=1974746 RepID=A0A2H0LYM2_9BACT|nr:MAG: hypothetical protein COV72_02550 [Candidatus Omnitrophica bacterium CG11_big_fil_rev_8_21_14_0_20_42_13]